MCYVGQTNAAASVSHDHDLAVVEVLIDVGTRFGVTFPIEEAVAKGGTGKLRYFRRGTFSKGLN